MEKSLMTSNLYPVGFGTSKTLKTVEYYSNYTVAMKAVQAFRNATSKRYKYTHIQVGYDSEAELMVYNSEINSWVITSPCWTEEDFLLKGKIYTLQIPYNRTRAQKVRMNLGWADSVVELFQTKFGVRFLNMKTDWKAHKFQIDDPDDVDATQYFLRYSCIVPERSMRAIKESYGCLVL